MDSVTPSLDFNGISLDDPEFQSKLDSMLFQAISNGQLNKILQLIQHGGNPTATMKKGRTGTTHGLLVAVQNDISDGSSSNLLPALLSAKSSIVNASDSQGNTALHVAAQRNQVHIVEALLQSGADANVRNLQGNTPLHQSVSRPISSLETEKTRSRQTVELLLSKMKPEHIAAEGLPLNKQGESPLMKAVHQGNLDGAQTIVNYLLKLASDSRLTSEQVRSIANTKNLRGLGPIHEAAIWAKTDILRYLVECKCNGVPIFDPCSTDNNGNTALHLAGDRRLTGITTGSIDHIKLLVSMGIPVNAQNSAGDTALHIVDASREYLEIILAHGGNLVVVNDHGDTALTTQIRAGRAHNCELIVQHMITQNIALEDVKPKLLVARDAKGNSLAHLLASIDSEHFGLVTSELYHIVNNAGETPLQVAIEEKSLKVLTMLLPTASESDLQAVRDARDPQGNSMLHNAVEIDFVEGILALLLFAKIEVDLPNLDMDAFSDGGIPLHLAACTGSKNAMETLITHGAQIDSQANPNSDTPLHLAIRFNHYDCVKILLDHHASTTVLNKDEITPLQEIRNLKGADERIIQLCAEENE